MATKETKIVLSATTSKYERAMRDAKRTSDKTTKGMTAAWKRHNRTIKSTGKLVAAFATGMSVAYVAAMKASIDRFEGFETALTDMGKVSNRSFKELRADVMSIDPVLGSATELMKGYYQVISAGVTEPVAALGMLTTTAKAAKAAHVEQSEVIKGLTKVMAGYGGEIATAAEAADLLFTIEKVGQTSVAELIPLIGSLSKASKDLNISQDELGGSFAQITQLAGNSEEAATQYQAVLTGLIKPSVGMKKAFKDMGFESAQAAIKQLGLHETLKKLKESTGGSSEKMAELFGNVRALKGIAALSVNDFDNMGDKIKQMGDKTDAMNDAFERWKGTIEAVKEVFKNQLHKVMIEIGEDAAPKVMTFLKDFSTWLKTNKGEIVETFGKMGDTVAWLAKIAGIAVTELNRVLTVHDPQGKLLKEIEAQGEALEDFYTVGKKGSKLYKAQVKAQAKAGKKSFKDQGKAAKGFGKTVADVTDDITKDDKKAAKDKAKLLADLRKNYAKTWAKRIALAKDAREKEKAAEKKIAQDKLHASQTFLDGVGQGFKELEGTQKHWADHGRESAFKFAADASDSMATFINPLKDDFLQVNALWDTMLESMVGSLTKSVADMAVQWGIGQISAAGSSFGWWDTGLWKAQKDQMGVVHKDEMVVPAGPARVLRGEGPSFSADTAFGGKNPQFAKDFAIGAMQTHGLYSMQGFGHLLAGNIDVSRLVRGITDPRAIMTNTIVGGMTNAAPNALGLSGKWADMGQNLVGWLGGAALGPAGAIAGAVLGAGILDAIGDALDLRENEAFRDFFEGAFGNIMGGQAYKSFQSSLSMAGGEGGGFGGFGGGFESMGAGDLQGSSSMFAERGMPFVPRTGPAFIHQGERIFSNTDNQQLIAAINNIGTGQPGGNTYNFINEGVVTTPDVSAWFADMMYGHNRLNVGDNFQVVNQSEAGL